jgi:hypothetical protein
MGQNTQRRSHYFMLRNLEMPNIAIRNLPPHLHRWLKDESLKSNRTLSQQTMIVVARQIGFNLPPQILAARRKRRPCRVERN